MKGAALGVDSKEAKADLSTGERSKSLVRCMRGFGTWPLTTVACEWNDA